MTTPEPGGEFRWLLDRIRGHRVAIATLLGLFVLATGLSLVHPLILRYLIDRVFVDGVLARLWPALAVLVGVSIAQILLNQGSTYAYTKLAGRVVLDLRVTLFRHLERLPLRFHAENRAGDIASRIGGDIAEVQTAATGTVLAIATASMTLIATCVLLFVLDRTLFLWALLILPLSLGVGRGFARPIRGAAQEIREQNATLGSTLFDSLLGQHFIRAHGLETPIGKRFFRDGREVYGAVLRLTRLNCYAGGFNGLVSLAGTLIVLGIGGARVISGELSLGTLVAFQSYVTGLYGPVQGLVSLYLRLQRSRVSVRRIREVMDRPRLPRGGVRSVPDRPGVLEFEGVGFAYDAGTPILAEVSFAARPGTKTAIIGPSGIGKSTLLDLAIGLRHPTEGSVRWHGRPLEAYRPDALRGAVGVVSQDVFLFHASIGDNLRVVKPGASDTELFDALAHAGLRAWVEALPKGLDTSVGERALRLSQGQRQRLSLARAVLRRPRLLILDEATNALDDVSDAHVREALAPVFAGATTLIASHRRSLIEEADTALLLHDARIVSEGSPRDVLERVRPVATEGPRT